MKKLLTEAAAKRGAKKSTKKGDTTEKPDEKGKDKLVIGENTNILVRTVTQVGLLNKEAVRTSTTRPVMG